MTPPGRAATTATAREPRTNEVEFSRPEDLEPRPRLDVVDRSRRATRTLHRQARVLRTLGVMFVVGALAITAAAHTFVASDQQRIDSLQTELTQSLAEQQDLQLSRAELESPLRVLNIAEKKLGMVSPGSVSYLAPVNPGLTVAQAGSAAQSAAAASSTSRGGATTGGTKSAGSASSKTPSGGTARPGSSNSGDQSGAISPTG